MASLTQWTWVWVNSGSWGWTGGPGVLQSIQSQRVGHDWETELNWVGPQTGSLPRPQTVPLTSCTCSFGDSSFWRTKTLLPHLILQPSTIQGASVRSILGKLPWFFLFSFFWYIPNVNSSLYFPSVYPQRGHSLRNPFFLINESENSFYIHLNNSISLSLFFFGPQMHSIPSHKCIII